MKCISICSTPEQVEKYASCTLLSVAMESTTEIDSCIKFLEENEFIRLQHMDSGLRYSATQLGEFFQKKTPLFSHMFHQPTLKPRGTKYLVRESCVMRL